MGTDFVSLYPRSKASKLATFQDLKPLFPLVDAWVANSYCQACGDFKMADWSKLACFSPGWGISYSKPSFPAEASTLIDKSPGQMHTQEVPCDTCVL